VKGMFHLLSFTTNINAMIHLIQMSITKPQCLNMGLFLVRLKPTLDQDTWYAIITHVSTNPFEDYDRYFQSLKEHKSHFQDWDTHIQSLRETRSNMWFDV
jgi:hypothetical protein